VLRPNGTWSGIMGELIEKTYDFVVSDELALAYRSYLSPV
jgi:hypothetical protein